MKRLKRTIVIVVALVAGTGLAVAAEARERDRGVGHAADRVTRPAGIEHLDRGRHDVRHERYRKRGHGYGHRRHDTRSRSGHYRDRGRHIGKRHFRPHRGYAPSRSHRHRHRRDGHRYYGYGISFELDGIRYFLGGSDYRR